MDNFLILLLLVGIVATVYLVLESRGGVDTATTSRSPQEIANLAVGMVPGGTMSMRSSWMPTGSTETSAGFVYKRRASFLIALPLLVCFLIPGILYLVFGGKNQTLQVNVLAGATDQNTVQVSSSGAVARRRGRQFLRGLSGTRGTIPETQEKGEALAEPSPDEARPEPPHSQR